MKKAFSILVIVLISKISFGQQAIKSQIDYFGLVTKLMEYKNEVSESYHLIKSWVFIDKKSDTPQKIKLKDFCQYGLNRLNERLALYDYLLDTSDLVLLLKIREEVNELTKQQLYIMNALKSFESYDDPLIVFEVIPSVEYEGSIQKLTDQIIEEMDQLIQKKSLEYIEFISRQNSNPSPSQILKTKKIKQLLDLLNVSDEIKGILAISNRSGLSKSYLEKDIYEILLQKYDKYYTINEIEDLIAFYKTKTGKRMIKVSKKMMLETLTEIMSSLK